MTIKAFAAKVGYESSNYETWTYNVNIPVTSIILNKSSLSLQTGQSETLTATVKPDNATDKTVTWTSSNTSIATVDNNGKVTAKAKGSATITCKANDGSGKQATCSVTVTDPIIKVTSITLNKTSLSLETGKSETLTATVKPDNATDKTVSWTSNNASVATVDNNGMVTAKAKGSATITCTANDGSGVKATCSVTVTDPIIKVTSITLNKASLSLETGQNETLTATVKPDNATDKTVSWTSNNASVATVDNNGKVTAKAKGSATITCTANDGSGVQATCAVTVTDPGYTDISQYANIVYLEPASTSPESSLTLPVKMKNAQANISGFQFDLVLPTGVTVAKDEDDFYLIELSTDRTTTRKHTVSASHQADGSIRVVCYSNNNSTFSGTDGNVLTMTLQVAADAPTGETGIKLRDVVMTTPALDSYNVPWMVSKLTIEDYTLGDVNGDKLVNVVDVAGVVNLILNSGDTSKLNRKAADINGDNIINVVDVAGVVNIILGGGANARMASPLAAAEQSRLYIDNFSMDPGETKAVSVNMSNPGDSFTGCQFDLYLPEGMSVAEEDGFPLIEIGSRSTARKHTVSATVQSDGSLRIVCYSNNNFTFTGENGEILTIAFHAADNAPSGISTVWMRNITLSRTDVTGVSPEDTSTEVSIGDSEQLNDGDYFTVNSVEGIPVTFRVISAVNRTCEVSGPNKMDENFGMPFPKAIDDNTTGMVTIPVQPKGYKVTKIGDHAFVNCENVTSVLIPASVTTIGKMAFWLCRSMTTVGMPDDTNIIGESAFAECSSLKSVKLRNVFSLGASAYEGCWSLTSVYSYDETANDYPMNVFFEYKNGKYQTKEATLYVPKGSKGSYQNSPFWSLFQYIVEMNGSDIPSLSADSDGSPTIFSLSGQRLTVPKKGVNIVDGKKVVIK